MLNLSLPNNFITLASVIWGYESKRKRRKIEPCLFVTSSQLKKCNKSGINLLHNPKGNPAFAPLWIHSSKKKKVAQKKEKGPDYTPTDVQSWGFDEPNFRKAFFSRFKPSNFHEQYRYHPKRETPSVANPLVNSMHYGDMNTDRGASLLSSSPFVKVFLVPYCLTVCYSLNLSERSEIYSSLFAGLNF